MTLVGYSAEEFLLGLVIYRESAFEPIEGKIAVGHVILTRVAHPRYWGRDLYSVIVTPKQFSSMTIVGDPTTIMWPQNPTFSVCLQIASGLLSKEIPNPLPGADHYCTAAVAAKTKWADEKKFLKQIGNHRFYCLEVETGGVT